jgi:hypothetical protein
MIASLAFLSAFLAPGAGTTTESQAAVRAFREGCTDGTLRLSSDRGMLVPEAKVPEYAKLNTGKWTNRRFIKFKIPAETYLALGEAQHPQPRSLVTICRLVSRKITYEDGAKALVETAPEISPRQTWIPSMYLPEWIVDLPKRGYRKRLFMSEDGIVLLEVGMYRSPSP